MKKRVSTILITAMIVGQAGSSAWGLTFNYMFPAVSSCHAIHPEDAPLFALVERSDGEKPSGLVNKSSITRSVVCGLPLPVRSSAGTLDVYVRGLMASVAKIECSLLIVNLITNNTTSEITATDNTNGSFALNMVGTYKYDLNDVPNVMVSCDLPAGAGILGISVKDTY